MPHDLLKANVRYQPGLAIIDLSGEINALAENLLNSVYNQATQHSTTVLLNFSQVNYINSTGLALLVNLLIQARRSGYRLLICGLNNHYVKTFEITRLADFMQIFPDEASVLKALQVPG